MSLYLNFIRSTIDILGRNVDEGFRASIKGEWRTVVIIQKKSVSHHKVNGKIHISNFAL